MKKIILCRGIQASGKSTYSKAWVLEEPEARVRFSYDDIRRMLGKYWVPSRESLIKSMRNDFLKSAMDLGYNIIIDNMNLNPKEIEYYKEIVDENPEYELEMKDFFEVSLRECISRDSKRPEPIGAGVITATYNRYKEMYGLK